MVVNIPSAMNRRPFALLILGLLAISLTRAHAEDRALELRAIVTDGTEGAVKLKLESRVEDPAPQELSCGREVLLDSTIVKEAHARQDPHVGWTVAITLTDEGKKKFLEVTTKYVGKRIGIISEGRLISAPVVAEPIAGGSVEISGALTETTARHLADTLMKGSKPETLGPGRRQS